MRRPRQAAGTASVLWLATWDMALWWRRFGGHADPVKRRLFLGLLATVLVLLHLFGFGTVTLLSRVPGDLPSGLVLPLSTGAAIVLWTLLTAQALSGATRAFFDAGALDLLFSSPVPRHRILAVRGLVLALTTTLPFAVFVLPIANMGLVVSGPTWLGLYPVLVALGLLATSAGLVLALTLVRVLGARATRSAGQIVAVLIGTGLGFAVQAFNRLSTDDKIDVIRRMTERGSGEVPAWEVVAWLPGRALLGQASDIAVLFVLAVLVFALTLRVASGRFSQGRADALVVAGIGRRSAPRRRVRPFPPAASAALRRKEWLLLVRDPWILMPVAQRAFALIPLCLALAGLDRSGDLLLSVSAPMLVVFAGKLASGIAWLTLAAEDAPELMATAPIAPAQVIRAKVEAALAATALLFSCPLLLLAASDTAVAALAACGAAAATVSVTLLALAEPSRVRRRDFRDRFRNFGPFAVAELVSTGLWAAATWLAVQGHPALAIGAAALSAGMVALLVRLMRSLSGSLTRRGAAGSNARQAVSRIPS